MAMIEGLRGYAKKHSTGLITLGTLVFVAGLYYHQRYLPEQNLDPTAIWVGGTGFNAVNGNAFLVNKNIDNDPQYESVIRYVGKDGKYYELPLVKDEQGVPKIIYNK